MKFTFVALVSLSTSVIAADQTVIVNSNNFSPRDITVSVGDTVTFTNQGGFHNVISDDGTSNNNAFRCANGCDGDVGGNGDAASNSWSFSLTFFSEEMIGYYCGIHGSSGGNGMSGTINVIDDIIFNNDFETIPG
ncbi:cupredoxin domain-containing protein [Marinicella rhabdoformis]|uniref:cupredoxin domain-containing protein n=1 Tax=Marinicella rhabdoformis TaxID=2580566 RepID=UPI0012AEC13F|nr:plastocyanin/azurin family copper-binding protein [Marinicella rhabdoformis]